MHKTLGHGMSQISQLCEPFTTRVVRIGSTAYGVQIEFSPERTNDQKTIPAGEGSGGWGMSSNDLD